MSSFICNYKNALYVLNTKTFINLFYYYFQIISEVKKMYYEKCILFFFIATLPRSPYHSDEVK